MRDSANGTLFRTPCDGQHIAPKRGPLASSIGEQSGFLKLQETTMCRSLIRAIVAASIILTGAATLLLTSNPSNAKLRPTISDTVDCLSDPSTIKGSGDPS